LSGEVFGSWWGRTAARFRTGVDELIREAGVDVEIGQEAQAWLAARPGSDRAGDRR
jgi:hypothetical protein